MDLHSKLKQLEDSKPKLEQFQGKEEFEEAYNYWMMRQGQSIPILKNLLKGYQQR